MQRLPRQKRPPARACEFCARVAARSTTNTPTRRYAMASLLLSVLLAVVLASIVILQPIPHLAMRWGMPALDYLRTFLSMLLSVLHVAIPARVILSWFPIRPENAITRTLHEITEPVLAPFRRVIPRLGVFDLAPFAAVLVISFVAGQLNY
jgi:YggT family protein